MNGDFSHLNASGEPQMVPVTGKEITQRVARAQAKVWLGPPVLARFDGSDIQSKKGAVFQTAVLAGVMAAKKTGDLIPLCHPISIEDCQITIVIEGSHALIQTRVAATGRTGVEMEALTAATVAALTVYDMCKALSYDMRIEEVFLVEKTGGKSHYTR